MDCNNQLILRRLKNEDKSKLLSLFLLYFPKYLNEISNTMNDVCEEE